MVIDGDTTLGMVMAFSGYVALMASPLSQIANLVSTALNAAAGGERVYDIVDEEPTSKTRRTPSTLSSRAGTSSS